MRKKILAALLTVCFLWTLPGVFTPLRASAAGGVYFTAVNDTLLPLSDDTMPFWSGGNLYVPSSVFTGTDLGVTYSRSTADQTATLSASKKVLTFDLNNGGSNNHNGTYYSAGAMSRHGYLWFPVSFVADYFDLNYSVIDTAYAPLVRLRSSGAVLSDAQFTDAGATLMASRYQAYQQSKTPTAPSGGNTTPPAAPTEETPEQTDDKSGTTVYLAFSVADGAQATTILNTLDRYGEKATFFVSADFVADNNDLVRRIIATGNRIGFRLPAQNTVDGLQEANTRLRAVSGGVTRMTLSGQGSAAAAQAAGYCVYTADISAAGLGTTASGRINRVMTRLAGRSGTVRLLFDDSDLSVSALSGVLSRLRSDGYSRYAATELSCE